uniref:Uncharacterized protein n=1 Tax=Caenorhabditis japonica TaxID=281687 RepID=A0A8R1DPW5_CAEJA
MIHDDYNPYTAVQRSPSQWFVFVPAFEPLNNTTTLTLSNDAVNLNSVPPSAESVHSFQSRYVVPEVIAYGSSSEVDTRSAGNPYSHHPNFTTPSQYFGHLDNVQKSSSGRLLEAGDVLTIMDIQNLKDPFSGKDEGGYEPAVSINPPNDVTVNKNALTSESMTDLQNLYVSFPIKGSPAPARMPTTTANDTVNKKLLSPESMYELAQHDANFESKDNANLLVIREFSPQSLADLREVRNFSAYTDFERSSKDVSTCLGISPTPYEKQMFERTENWAYGGL